MFKHSPQELRDLVKIRKKIISNNKLGNNLDEGVERVIYQFEIIKFETFRAKSDEYNFVKFTFLLWNKNESFEEEQILSYDDDMLFTKRYDEFVQQFAYFYGVKNESEFEDFKSLNGFEDFIGEKGKCHISYVYQGLKVYRKVIINSLEVNDNE